MPPLGHDETSDLPEPYQSLGQRGVTNLEGKLVGALFPSTQPWFIFQLSKDVEAQTDPEAVREINQALLVYTYTIWQHMNSTQFRTTMRERIRHILFGDSLALLKKDFKQRPFRADEWICYRDNNGEWQVIITKEKLDARKLDPDQQRRANIDPNLLGKADPHDREVDLYTRVERLPDGRGFRIEQEVEGAIVSTKKEYVCSYLLARYEEITGEDYGRGLVDHVLPDLKSYNGLWRSIIFASAAMARIIVGVDPAGRTNKREVDRAQDGQIIAAAVENGALADVGILQLNKYPDLRVTFESASRIEQRLSKAFLLESELQPTGDRVTAFQIQRIAAELDGALGGVYATIADELQGPFLERYTKQLEDAGKIPRLPVAMKKASELKVLTGIEALGQEDELQRLLTVLQVLATLPDFAEKINSDEVNARVTRLRGVDSNGLLKSDKELQQQREQNAQLELQQSAGQAAIDATSNIVQDQVTRQ
jgi:hypothetical protein